MKELIVALQKIIPDEMKTLSLRYQLLRTVYYEKSIGRRLLSSKLRLTERVARAETEFLKEVNFIEVKSSGMTITPQGIEMIDVLQDFVYELRGIHKTEEILQNLLQVQKVSIVPGNLEEDPYVINELGRQAAKCFMQVVRDGMNIAITGGTTIAGFVSNMPKKRVDDITIVPARGSVGHNVEYQANTLAAELASKLGGEYKNFSIPDNLSAKAMESILEEREIQEVIAHMKKAQILVCGIGNALDMANKRNFSEEIKELLLQKNAVSEAFGYYFNSHKELVYISHSIGIKLEDVKNIDYVIAIAGGSNKAQSIASAPFLKENSILVLDEGAAQSLIKYLQTSKSEV